VVRGAMGPASSRGPISAKGVDDFKPGRGSRPPASTTARKTTTRPRAGQVVRSQQRRSAGARRRARRAGAGHRRLIASVSGARRVLFTGDRARGGVGRGLWRFFRLFFGNLGLGPYGRWGLASQLHSFFRKPKGGFACASRDVKAATTGHVPGEASWETGLERRSTRFGKQVFRTWPGSSGALRGSGNPQPGTSQVAGGPRSTFKGVDTAKARTPSRRHGHRSTWWRR